LTAAGRERQGGLKIFLGYAAGVGKTYKMLEEAQQLRAQGRDIAVGYFEPHGRQETIAKLAGLELVPRRLVRYRGCDFEEMDADAILARRPEICVVDELPHTNVPGSRRAKRWEDVVALLDAGIDVLTTMNIQHLEGLNDQVREISGVQVRETVPDWIVDEASEIVAVDLTPQALLNRLARGVVYPMEKAAHAMENFFREPTLAALREMALRQAAHVVDARQSRLAVPGAAGTGAEAGSNEPRERILIHMTDSPATSALIRRGRRVADYLKADCFAVAVVPLTDTDDTDRGAPDALEEHLAFARQLHIDARRVRAGDVAEALVDFARRNGVTQILVAKPRRRSPWLLYKHETAMRVVELARDMQVIVVAERRPAETPPGAPALGPTD
jgi:two-component system, OmpR family, sensor histidine kinase KdpD